MTRPSSDPVTRLSEERSWELLRSQQVGRLATAVDRMPMIFPVNYVVDEGPSLVFRTAEGTKLFALAINSYVALEIDGWDAEGGWSVIARGSAEIIHGDAEVEQAEALPLKPWVPTVKVHFVRIRPDEVNGREFRFGDEPEPNYT